jgi:hypothetical protein
MGVVRLLFPVLVYGAVQLNDEAAVRAVEVQDVTVQRLLAPKFEAMKPPLAEALPQASLGMRAHPPQLARALE